MRKIIIAIMLILCAFGARTEDTGITTSQAYVETKVAEKQDAVPANNANSVMTYDSTSSDGIGTKAIYNESSSYETQTNALLTAGTANAAIQNAIDNEFTCANPPKCTLWRMTGLFPPTLPAGYTELEYIVFDGESYVDTGIVLTDSKNIENVVNIKAQTFSGSSFRTIIGFMPAASTNIPRYSINIYLNKWMMGIDSTNLSAEQADTNKHKFVFVTTDSTQTLYDSDNILITKGLPMYALNSNTLSLYLGARHNSSGVQNYFIGNIGPSYLKQNGVMLYNYIPCRRDSDNVVGFYDTVSQTFKTNGGNGTLVAGPVASYIPQNQ